MTTKEAIEGWRLLDKLAQDIAEYAIRIGFIESIYGGRAVIDCVEDIDGEMAIFIYDYSGSTHRTVYIPITHIKNDTWKEYLDRRMKKKVENEKEYKRLIERYG